MNNDENGFAFCFCPAEQMAADVTDSSISNFLMFE
jgi:hypothetical protein